jgi:hypothetical protein
VEGLAIPMTAIFATMLIALILDRSGPRSLAVPCLLLCLILSVWLFLWEIYSPDYGFRMPWLQVEMESRVALLRVA